ncbi:nad(p)h nitroreductase ydgi-related [Anaeramoeba flamelloides]|uniref:Nad(P)h nitroreductase ydgi-related n=1 Tax=Anaeramoeba flamelloides TaxID=1746091 RepID=A0AAV7YGH6_9EUKA|nr:nad(p)h nitroreductase ydgi-related [Anaeramoeba flamelloides]
MELLKIILLEGENPMKIQAQRSSVRFYKGRSTLPIVDRHKLVKLANGIHKGPFGTKIRMKSTEKKMGTFNYITTDKKLEKNPYYIVGCVSTNVGVPEKTDRIDFGYEFEKIILYASALGVGTCWLGGTFLENEANSILDVNTDTEKVYAITPFGMEKIELDINERKKKNGFTRMVMRNTRKPNNLMFFIDVYGNEIQFDTVAQTLGEPKSLIGLLKKHGQLGEYEEEQEEGKKNEEKEETKNEKQNQEKKPQQLDYDLIRKLEKEKPQELSEIWEGIFESVKWAPSAVNEQDWRIVFDQSERAFHFLIESTRSHYCFLNIGIAMLHFELSCLWSGYTGRWEKLKKSNTSWKLPKDVTYSSTFYMD